MRILYTPYVGKRPVPFLVNGHRLLILSPDHEIFEDQLASFGAERIGEVRFGDSQEDERKALDRLARSVEGGVVVATADLDLDEVLANLTRELPWVH